MCVRVKDGVIMSERVSEGRSVRERVSVSVSVSESENVRKCEGRNEGESV